MKDVTLCARYHRFLPLNLSKLSARIVTMAARASWKLEGIGCLRLCVICTPAYGETLIEHCSEDFPPTSRLRTWCCTTDSSGTPNEGRPSTAGFRGTTSLALSVGSQRRGTGSTTVSLRLTTWLNPMSTFGARSLLPGVCGRIEPCGENLGTDSSFRFATKRSRWPPRTKLYASSPCTFNIWRVGSRDPTSTVTTL